MLPLSQPQKGNWMPGCVCVWLWAVLVCACVSFQKMFFIFFRFSLVLMSPLSSQRQVKVYYEAWISQLLRFKKKFSSIWKGGISGFLVWKMFWKIHVECISKLSSTTEKGTSHSRSGHFVILKAVTSIFYFMSRSVYWAYYVFIKIKNPSWMCCHYVWQRCYSVF